MAMVVDGKPILYVCPYCVKGKFTADDGWLGAKKHIRDKHQNAKHDSPRRGNFSRRKFVLDDDDLSEETYPTEEENEELAG